MKKSPLTERKAMSLTPTEVKKIAHLARLSINDDEVTSLTKDLDNILGLVAQMNEVDISAVDPLAHPVDAMQPLRNDVVTEKNQRDIFLKNAPQTYMGLYIVPQVIETGE